MLIRLMFDRWRTCLTRSTMVVKSIHGHWQIMRFPHPLILKLIEDSEDGDARRTSLAEWQRTERPVLDALRGTSSQFRIDGPRQLVGTQCFAFGSLIESPGVTAHLDPVDTLHLESRMRRAIEHVLISWIEQRKLRDTAPVEPSFNREEADGLAIAQMYDWAERDHRVTVASDVE
jgi:hypothetical protein